MAPSIQELLQRRKEAKAEEVRLKEETESRVKKAKQERQSKEAEQLVEAIKNAVSGDMETALMDLVFTPVPGLEPAGFLEFKIHNLASRFRIICTKPVGANLVWKMEEFVPGQDRPFRLAPKAEGHMDSKKMQDWVLDFIQLSAA